MIPDLRACVEKLHDSSGLALYTLYSALIAFLPCFCNSGVLFASSLIQFTCHCQQKEAWNKRGQAWGMLLQNLRYHRKPIANGCWGWDGKFMGSHWMIMGKVVGAWWCRCRFCHGCIGAVVPQVIMNLGRYCVSSYQFHCAIFHDACVNAFGSS